MIDFDRLVLGPAMAVFGRPIMVSPLKSQPLSPDYLARGVWSSTPVDVQTMEGIVSSQAQTLGIRAADFDVPPVPGDNITIDAYGSQPRIGVCYVEDTDDDGQGGTVLTLKVIGP